METTVLEGKSGRGLSGGALKMVAIAAMLVDHAALLFVPSYYGPLGTVLHFIGRLTGPLMFFFIVEGYHHTHNANRYTARLALFAVISYLPFVLFINNGLPQNMGGWLRLNVIYTLTLGLLALRALHEVKNPFISAALIGLCLVFSVLGDWEYVAVLAILLLDLLRENPKNQRIGFCLLVLMNSVMPLFSTLALGKSGDAVIYFRAMVVGMGMMVPMFLLGLYNGKRGRGGKWLFYIFYPAHLLLLWLVGQALGLQVGL